MRITVKAKASSKANQLELRDNIYHVWVKAVARDGKANAAIIKLLATHFGIP